MEYLQKVRRQNQPEAVITIKLVTSIYKIRHFVLCFIRVCYEVALFGKVFMQIK